MAEEQLGYSGERLTKTKNYWFPRGDTRDLIFEHDLGPSQAIKTAQLEVETNDSTATTILSLTLADHSSQWDFTTDDEGTVTINAVDTATLNTGVHRYAIQLTDLNDRVYTPVKGTLHLAVDVVDNTGTSPYPSWTTLDDLEEDIEQMATCADISWLTTAIAGGEGTIYVQNGAIFTAGDDIRVVLDSGAYEDDTIAAGGVSGNALTLSATIAGVAAVGNVVRIK
jgi:hypothetical protein